MTSPLISTTPARTEALTLPFSPMMRLSLVTISPLNLPFSMTVPLKVYLPSISEPSSMQAVRSLLRLAGLLLRHRIAFRPGGGRLPLPPQLRGSRVGHELGRALAGRLPVQLRCGHVQDA